MSARDGISAIRNLAVIFGDQLNSDSAVFDGFDKRRDAVLMMEVREEATYIAQHKIRLVLFFSAMRHFRKELRERGYRVYYRELEDVANTGAFESELQHWCRALLPSHSWVRLGLNYGFQKRFSQPAAQKRH